MSVKVYKLFAADQKVDQKFISELNSILRKKIRL